MPKVRTVPLAEKGLSQSEKYAIIRYSHMSETEQAQNELQARLGAQLSLLLSPFSPPAVNWARHP